MLIRISLLLAALYSTLQARPSIDPTSVVIVYNTNNAESSKLAFYYARQRSIPDENIVGLDTPDKGHISRAEYISTIQNPLRRQFQNKVWWKLAKTADGIILPLENKKRLLVCMYGVPFGILQQKIPKEESDKMHITQRANSAAVDSELAVLGIQGVPIQGPLPNKYFKKDYAFSSQRELTPYFMVGRIDGPDFATSKRLIDDAIATEKQGLWGMCYLDIALKGGAYKIGDEWLKNIDKLNWQKGIPTTVDNNKQTYLSNYPMRDVSLYYGWYTSTVNGPFRNPDFEFKRGAVAIHLHSFSASNLRDKNKHWVGPLLYKGAAATVGNVYEPYLQMTHYFDILNDRLIDGYTFIEAASMAIPVLSWQNVAIGDPLYQPFKRLDGTGVIEEEDKFYRSINLTFNAWKSYAKQLKTKLTAGAINKNDARYYEVLGLWNLHSGDSKQALAQFSYAAKKYTTSSDKVRIALHLANIYVGEKKKNLAVGTLEEALIGRQKHTSGRPLKSMLNILNPPPPPAAEPRKKLTPKN
ncbi:MAG: TIGR03790 family protein [Rubritalea sp.]|uniref:TIGR03790 family protein n=1 Tax=Rubritalea sp. TaxID=2109375 RepID=UPI0032426E8E